VWGKVPRVVRAWRQPARRVMELMHVSLCAVGAWHGYLLVSDTLSLACQLNIKSWSS
jgi:hypothetical protein